MTTDIRIDPLTPQGHDALVTLMRETWTAAFAADMDPDDVRAHLASKLSPRAIEGYFADFSFLVAHDGAHPVGFVQFGAAKPDLPFAPPGSMEIRRLYVLESHQNQGIGTSLLEAALATPELSRAAQVLVEVWDENFDAQRLYDRFGFVRVGEIAFTIEEKVLGHDLVLARAGAETS